MNVFSPQKSIGLWQWRCGHCSTPGCCGNFCLRTFRVELHIRLCYMPFKCPVQPYCRNNRSNAMTIDHNGPSLDSHPMRMVFHASQSYHVTSVLLPHRSMTYTLMFNYIKNVHCALCYFKFLSHHTFSFTEKKKHVR